MIVLNENYWQGDNNTYLLFTSTYLVFDELGADPYISCIAILYCAAFPCKYLKYASIIPTVL